MCREKSETGEGKIKNDKNISGLLNQIEEQGKTGKIGIHTFTNTSAYTIADTKIKVISIEFAFSEENHMQFLDSFLSMPRQFSKNGVQMLQEPLSYRFRLVKVKTLKLCRIRRTQEMEKGRQEVKQWMNRQGQLLTK